MEKIRMINALSVSTKARIKTMGISGISKGINENSVFIKSEKTSRVINIKKIRIPKITFPFLLGILKIGLVLKIITRV